MKKQFKLDTYEQEIEKAIVNGTVKKIPLTEKEKNTLSTMAKYTLKRLKKDARINIRVEQHDLSTIQQKALANGLPYQTLISTLLHQFALGKITITL